MSINEVGTPIFKKIGVTRSGAKIKPANPTITDRTKRIMNTSEVE